MSYQSISLRESIGIEDLYTIHYFEYMNDFSFSGESHNFWEFCFVDKGEVAINTDTTLSILKKGDIAFHKPNEFHNVKASGGTSPNLVVISFKCDAPYMDFFQDKLFKVDEIERNLLADIMIETRNCFSNRLDDPYSTKMVKKEMPSAFAAEHLIKIYLEHFLIHLFRRYSSPLPDLKKSIPALPKATKSKNDVELFHRVTDYLEHNLNARVTIEDICRQNLIGRSQLQKLFRERSGLGIIEYFSNMKIDAAKEMIRNKRMNFTQISEQLGYSSIHYFSRQFKNVTNMTPSEYASSIKAMAEGHFPHDEPSN